MNYRELDNILINSLGKTLNDYTSSSGIAPSKTIYKCKYCGYDLSYNKYKRYIQCNNPKIIHKVKFKQMVIDLLDKYEALSRANESHITYSDETFI